MSPVCCRAWVVVGWFEWRSWGVHAYVYVSLTGCLHPSLSTPTYTYTKSRRKITHPACSGRRSRPSLFASIYIQLITITHEHTHTHIYTICTSEVQVVGLALLQEAAHLLHVRHPVDLRVCVCACARRVCTYKYTYVSAFMVCN